MYFTLEHKGERKLVSASRNSSLSHVSQLAFPGSLPGDVGVCAATNKKEVALAAMCKVWPAIAPNDSATKQARQDIVNGSTCIGGNPSVNGVCDVPGCICIGEAVSK